MYRSRFVKFICISLLLTSVLSCSRSSDSKDDIVAALSKSLVARLPESTLGFFKWDAGSDSYQRLLKSPWAGTGDVSVYLGKHVSSFEDVALMLKAAGFDITNETFWTKTFSEAVFFLTPSLDAEKKGAEKGVLLSPKESDLNGLFQAIRKTLTTKNIEVKDVDAQNVKEAFEFSITRDGKQEHFVLGRNERLAALVQSTSMLESLMVQKPQRLPAVVASAKKLGLFKNLPSNSDRFALGVLHLDELPGASFNNVTTNASGIALCSIAMLKTPVTDLRFHPGESNSFSDWKTRSESEDGLELTKTLRTKPLLYLDSDGISIERIIQTVKSRSKNKDYAASLASLEIPSRFALAVDAKSSTQSFLPIPDFYLVLKTSNPSKLKNELEGLISNVIKSQGALGGMAWVDKSLVEGVVVKMIASPIGFSIYLGSHSDKVILTSSEMFLKKEISQPGGGDPKAIFQTGSLGSLTAGSSLGNVLIDFKEVAVLLESVGGTLKMFAPQQQGQEILEEENIEKLKGLGVLVAEVRLKKEVLSLHSYYE